MAEEHTLRLNIDASGAEAGAQKFKAAAQGIANAAHGINTTAAANLRALKSAISGFQAPTADSAARMAAFKAALHGLTAPDGAQINNFSALKSALSGFQAPSGPQVANLRLLGGALRELAVSTTATANIVRLSQALSNFRAPSQASIRNFQQFSAAALNLRVPADIGNIVRGLNEVTAAAGRAAAAMRGLQGARPGGWTGGVSGRSGGSGGDYTPRGNQGYGPRTNNYQYEGILSGETRATGELRGFENLANPSFQAASIARVAVAGGALTAGEGIKSLMEEGQALIMFQHRLEIVTTNTNDAVKSQADLANMMQFATNIALQYGLSIGTVRDSFARFAIAAQAAGFSQAQMKQIFGDMSVAMRSMGADTETQTRIFRALDQIMQTGHVSMLQLHREIGLQMPAIRIMSEALGVSATQIEKMSKAGTLGSETLVKFAARAKEMYAPGLATAMNSPVAALERLKDTFVLTMDSMLNGGFFNKLGEQFNRLADMLRTPEVQAAFVRIANTLGTLIQGLVTGIDFLAHHLSLLGAAFLVFTGMGVIGTLDRIGGGLLRMTGRMASLAEIFPQINAGMSRFRREAEGIAAVNTNSGAFAMGGAAANAASAGMSAASRTGGASSAANRFTRAAPLLLTDASKPNFTMMGEEAVQAATKVGIFTIALNYARTAASGLWVAMAPLLLNPYVLAFTAIALAITGTVAALYNGRDAVVEFAGTTTTTGAIWSEWWAEMKAGFADMASSASGSMMKVLNFITPGAPNTDSFSVWLTYQIAEVKALAADVAKLPEAARHGQLFTQQTSAEDIIRQTQAAAEARRRAAEVDLSTTEGQNNRANREHFNNAESVNVMGRSAAQIEATADAYAKMMDKIDSTQKATDQYNASMKTLTDALKDGTINQDQFNHAVDEANYKFGQTAGFILPAVEALHKYDEAMRGVAAAVELRNNAEDHRSIRNEGGGGTTTGLSPGQAAIIQQQKERELLRVTNPAEFEHQQLLEQDRFTKMAGGNKAIGSKLMQVQNETEKNTGIPMTDAAIAQLISDERHLMTDTAHAGKSPQQKAEDSYTRLKNEFSPEDKSLDEYQKAVTAIAEAQKKGIGNATEYQRILDGVKDKILAFTGGTVPAIKATNELAIAHERAAAALKLFPDQAARINSFLDEETKNLNAVIDPFSAWVKKMDDETAAMKMGNLERERKLALDKLNNQMIKDTGHGLTPEQTTQATGILADQQQAKWDEKQKNSGLQVWSDQVGSLSNELGKVEEKIADDLPKAFVKFVETGKLEWRSLVSSILTDIATIMAKEAEKNILESRGLVGPSGSTSTNCGSATGKGGLFGQGSLINNAVGKGWDWLTGGGGGSVGDNGIPAANGQGGDFFDPGAASNNGGGGLFSMLGKGLSSLGGSLFGSGGAAASAGADAGTAAAGSGGFFSSMFSSIASLFAAEGGYTSGSGLAMSTMMPRMAFAGAPHYAEGTTNTSGGMAAVVHPDEAIIPLSKGRSIPVELNSGMGGGGRGAVNVTMHIHTDDADSFRASKSQIETSLSSSLQRSTTRNGA